MNKLNAMRVVTVLAIASLALGACGNRLTADEKVDLARSQLAEGNAADAAIHLRNVLQEDPSNVPARVLLAEAALQLGDIETAVKEFRRALDLGTDLDEIRLAYAEALVRAGANEEALRVTGSAEAGDGPAISYWRALALVADGMLDDAEALFQRVAQDPALQTPAQVGLARVAVARQRPEEALTILDRISRDAASSSNYWETVAIASSQAGQYLRAAEAFAKAADTVVDAGGMQRFVYRGREVEALLSAGQLEQAHTRAERLYQQSPTHPLSNYVMGRVALQSGDPRQALAFGQAVIASQPDSTQGHLLVGMAHLGMGQVIQAERSLERAVAADSRNMSARRLLAQIHLGMQSPERALEAIGPITDESLDAGVATVAGMASVRAGDPDAAIAIFRRQLERNPDDAEARSMLAVSLMASGRVEEALAELARISDTDATARQRADLIEIAAHLQAGSVVQAREIAARLSSAFPDDVALRTSLGSLFLTGNQLDDAAAWLEDGLRLDSGNVVAHFNLGRIAAATGQLDKSRQHFDAIIALDSNNGAALAALAQLDWALGAREAAVLRLQKAREAEARDVSTRLLLASYLTEMDRPDEAREVAREAVDIAPESAAAANALGNALLQGGDAQGALLEFARAHGIIPSEALHLLNKARAEIALGQLEPARQTLVQALALEPDSIQGLAMMVAVERRLGRLGDAARTFARLEQSAPQGDARIGVVRGELLLAQEDYSAAERAFNAALEGGAGGPAAIGVFQARRRAGVASPDAPLLEWLTANPDDAQIRRLLGDYYIEAERYPAALEQYEKLLENEPANAVAANNIAWLYNKVGDPRALPMAKRAHELAPDNPMIADTYGWILHQRGETARALELISKAAEAAPRVGEIQYHHAVLLAETGDEAGAVKAARAVLAEPAAANFHEPAQKLLDRLGPGKE